LNSFSPVATIQLRSCTCRRGELAAILADSVALLQTPVVAEPTEVGVELSAEALHVVTGIRSASRPQGVRVGRGRHARDPRGGVEAGDVMAVPVAGQLGHGITASIRRPPVRIVEGPKEGGYRDAFEVICCDCGDHPYWDYCEISLSLQRIRGPYTTLAAALAAYDRHLGLGTTRRRS
jgi:hypothetical protein